MLEGGAGVGKTFLLAMILKEFGVNEAGFSAHTLCVAAPTHKAIGVLRRKLDAQKVEWCQGYDAFSFNGTDVITGTTAQLLGIRPIVDENQSSEEVKFKKTKRGILSKIVPTLLFIDEVSMLGKLDLLSLREFLKQSGAKMIAIGDAGQLPPVKQEAIPFDAFQHRAVLRQIVRQAEDSAIVKVAWAIREGDYWHGIKGKGVTKVDIVSDAFVDNAEKSLFYDLKSKAWRREEDRSVYIAYTNKKVNEVQDAVCLKLYDHGRFAFAPGELVLCETNLYRSKVLLAANQDELIVDAFLEKEKDPVCGIPVVFHHHSDPRKGQITAHYLSPDSLKDAEHPYVKELASRHALAEGLQEEFVRLRTSNPPGLSDLNYRRRKAWEEYFTWKDQTVISFRHPFAMTAHKSQGSTFRVVYADAYDLEKHSRHALYVAVTRPREELVLAGVGSSLLD